MFTISIALQDDSYRKHLSSNHFPVVSLRSTTGYREIIPPGNHYILLRTVFGRATIRPYCYAFPSVLKVVRDLRDLKGSV